MSFQSLPVRDANMEEWQRKAALIVNSHSRALQAAAASRPVSNLYVGQAFFDTAHGLPIWWNGTGWVKADGSSA